MISRNINIFYPTLLSLEKIKNLTHLKNFQKKHIPETTIIRKWRLGRERCIGNGNIITNRLAADKVWFASLISWCDGNRCKVSGKREFSQQRIKQPGSNRNHALLSALFFVISYFERWSYFICVNRSLSIFNLFTIQQIRHLLAIWSAAIAGSRIFTPSTFGTRSD